MKRNKFSLSHYKLFTCDMGYLIPLTWYEVIPGDTIQQATSCLIRVSPLLAPIMHPVVVRIHHWFVPLRLIWEDFEDFITGGSDGLDASIPPYRAVADYSSYESTILDYMGIPPEDLSGQSINFSILPFRAYSLIFNEHYRDQDLVTERTVPTASGADSTTSVGTLARVSWQKDYFTAARPWEQKGATVTIPLTGNADVDPTGDETPTFDATGISNVSLQAAVTSGNVQTAPPSGTSDLTWNDPKLIADLSSVSGVDINDLRLALAVQRYQEARAKYGSRYVEYLRYLGVRPSDARLQIPEYLGGGKQTIAFSEVLSTDSGGSDPVGDMKGHGIAAMRTNRYRRFMEEHGIVMSLMSVVPKAIYADGIHKSFSRTVKEDYYQRELQFVGEQEVLDQEVYALQTTPGDVFGYQARYDEYRSLPSTIAGEFRSSLDHWHMARLFTGDVALNSTFVGCSPTKRVLASESTDALYVMANHSIQARRPMALRATNKLV